MGGAAGAAFARGVEAIGYGDEGVKNSEAGAKMPRKALLKTEVKTPVFKQERKLLCFLDRTGEAEIGGWAVDFEMPAESLKMRAVIDGAIEGVEGFCYQ